MPIRDFASYRNLLLATHTFKNENVTRFFGYVGFNGKNLGPKEVSVSQDSFVHPMGALARTAVLRDVSNGDLKYGNEGVSFVSKDLTGGTADTYTHSGAPGRVVGVWLDNYNNISSAATLRLQATTAPGSKEYIGSVTTQHDIITNTTAITGTDSMDLTSNLFGLVGTTSANGNTYGYTSGTVTVAAPGTTAVSVPTIAVASPAVVTMTSTNLPFANGDAVIFSFSAGVFSGSLATGATVYIGNITKATNNVTFKIYPTAADALADTNAYNCTTAANGTNTIGAPNSGGTATATGVADDTLNAAGSPIGCPVKINVVTPGYGYASAPTLTWTNAGTGTPTYGFVLHNGRIRSVDIFHPCDIMPGGSLVATMTGSTTGAFARITYAIATHSS